MIVERVTVDRVREKLAGLKRQRVEHVPETIEEIQKRIEEQEKEEAERAKIKKRKIKEGDHVHNGRDIKEEEFEFDEEQITAFGIPLEFGSSKK